MSSEAEIERVRQLYGGIGALPVYELRRGDRVIVDSVMLTVADVRGMPRSEDETYRYSPEYVPTQGRFRLTFRGGTTRELLEDDKVVFVPPADNTYEDLSLFVRDVKAAATSTGIALIYAENYKTLAYKLAREARPLRRDRSPERWVASLPAGRVDEPLVLWANFVGWSAYVEALGPEHAPVVLLVPIESEPLPGIVSFQTAANWGVQKTVGIALPQHATQAYSWADFALTRSEQRLAQHIGPAGQLGLTTFIAENGAAIASQLVAMVASLTRDFVFVLPGAGAKGSDLWQVNGQGSWLTVGKASQRLSDKAPKPPPGATLLERHRTVLGFDILYPDGRRVPAVAHWGSDSLSGWSTLEQWKSSDEALSRLKT